MNWKALLASLETAAAYGGVAAATAYAGGGSAQTVKSAAIMAAVSAVVNLWKQAPNGNTPNPTGH